MILTGDFTVRGKGLFFLKQDIAKDKKYKRILFRNFRLIQRRQENAKMRRLRQFSDSK
jgi:hypothetical protein